MAKLLNESRIIIADDDAGVRRLLALRLKLEGFENVIHARDGNEVLSLIREEIPDLVLLDVMMPDMDGFEVLRTVRADYPTEFIPIIIISAFQDTGNRVRGIEAGANDFISKPFQPEEVNARIHSLLSLKSTRDELAAERQKIEVLYNINRAITEKLDVRYLLKLISMLTLDITKADKVTFVLLDEAGTFSEKVVTRRGEEAQISERYQVKVFQEGLIGWVMRHKQSILIADVTQDSRWIPLPEDDQAKSVIAVPILRGEHLNGVLIATSSQPDFFSQNDVDLLASTSGQVAITLENARLFEESALEKARFQSLIEETGDPVLIANREGVITNLNPAARARLGLDEAIIGSNLGDINLSLEDLFMRSQERRGAVSGDVTLRQMNGERTSYNVSVSPVKEIGYILTWRDITALRESEKARLDSEKIEKERFLDALSHYMSPTLFSQVLSDPQFFSRLERREAVVMFADLRGFTYLSTQLSPSQVMDVLNVFFIEMQEIVYKFEGIIFEVKGDELMIAFNVPYDQPDASTRALQAAIAMQRRFMELEKVWAEQGIDIGLGIGINSGDIVIGHTGSVRRKNYAMVGETVNIAHRLVDIAEKHQIIFTQPVALGGFPEAPDISLERLPSVKVKGKTDPLPLSRIEILEQETRI